MAREPRGDDERDVRSLWQSQHVEHVHVSLADIRRRSEKLRTRVLRRNLREYAAVLLLIAFFGYYLAVFHFALIRTGCGLVIAGALFVMYALHRRGAAWSAPANAGSSTGVDFLRGELERQRRLLGGVWSWYLLPFAPGLLIFLGGLLVFTLRQPNAAAHTPLIVGAFALALLACAAVFVVVGMINHRAAQCLQEDIAELDALGNGARRG